MRVSKLLRWSTVAAGLAVGVTACANDSTAPVASAGVERVESSLQYARGNGHGNKSEGQFTFVLDPREGYVLPFGDHQIRLPANTICEPNSTKYGQGEWDRACALAVKPIQFTVVYKTVAGEPEVRIFPDVRFTPTVDPAKWVVMSLKQNGRLDITKLYTIYWWDGGRWVDESKTDAALTAWTNYSTNTVSRRLKHFSGYSVTAGRGSQPSEGEATGY